MSKWVNFNPDSMQGLKKEAFIQLVTRIHNKLMFHCVFSFADMNSSETQQSPPAAIDGRTRSIKRKASPDNETPQKRKRISIDQACNTPQEDGIVKTVKRKASENGEEPSRKRKRTLDLHLQETESTSSSVDTVRGRFIM